MPMFNGVREDVKDLVRSAQLAWGSRAVLHGCTSFSGNRTGPSPTR
jgi:hypothetical protein